jgi:ABC-type transport system involved in cytochrome bd biosynthesis fused ATPase/permease subunit
MKGYPKRVLADSSLPPSLQVLALPEGDPELSGVSAEVPGPAERTPVVVVGDSGSGKTALMAMAFAQVCVCVCARAR